MRTYFENVKKNFGFGCMRLPMKDGEVDRDEIRCCGSLLTKAPLCDGLYAANAADKRRKLCFRSASGVA